MSEKKDFIMKPKVDFCFKELMVDPEIRKGFIAAVLGVKQEEIASTELMPTYLRKEHVDDKLGILDVRVLLNNSVQVDIEIQVAPFEAWTERVLFYLCKMFSSQIHEGDAYCSLEKCIHIGVLDFVLFPEDKEYYSCFHLLEDQRGRMYSDKLEIHTLELPKLADYEYPETELLNWARFMNAEKREEFEMVAKTSDSIQKAYDRLVNISADEKKRLKYEAREKALRDYEWQMKTNRAAGQREGEAAATERINKLNKKLIESGRMNDLVRTVSDPEYQKQLLDELDL